MPFSCVCPVSFQLHGLKLLSSLVKLRQPIFGWAESKFCCSTTTSGRSLLFFFLTNSVKLKKYIYMALVKPSSSWWTFFPVSSSIPYNCFLCWKYGRPLDFCLKIFWQSVNSFLFRRKAHKTVSFVVVAVVVLVWFLLKPVARPISRLLYEISPKVGEPSPALS